MYRSLSTATQRNALHFTLKLMEYRNAVLGTQVEIFEHCNSWQRNAVEYEQSLSHQRNLSRVAA